MKKHLKIKSESAFKKRLVIQDTKRYGKGVYAKVDIRKGEIIYILSGVRTTLADLVRRLNAKKEFIDDPFQIGKRTYLDLNEFSRTFNHSCDPNAGLRKNSELFALRDIKKGEQITYDYSLTIAPTTWKMKCSCGSPRCRKILGDIRSIPKIRRNEYLRMGDMQRYMKPIVLEINKGTYRIPDYEKKALAQLEVKHT